MHQMQLAVAFNHMAMRAEHQHASAERLPKLVRLSWANAGCAAVLAVQKVGDFWVVQVIADRFSLRVEFLHR